MRNTLQKISPLFLIALVLTLQGCLKSSNDEFKYRKAMFGTYYSGGTIGHFIKLDGEYQYSITKPTSFDKENIENGDRVAFEGYDFSYDPQSKTLTGEVQYITKATIYEIKNTGEEVINDEVLESKSSGIQFFSFADFYTPPFSSFNNTYLNFQVIFKGNEDTKVEPELLYNETSYKEGVLTLYLNVKLTHKEGAKESDFKNAAIPCTFNFTNVYHQHSSLQKLIIKYKNVNQTISSTEYAQPKDTNLWVQQPSNSPM